jgi:hypothetical protein
VTATKVFAYRVRWDANTGRYIAAVEGTKRLRMSDPDPVVALTKLVALIGELRADIEEEKRD